MSLLQHHDLRRHLSEAAGDLCRAICVEVGEVCPVFVNLLEAPRLLGIFAAQRNQTAVKIGGEGLSIFFALALGVVSGMLQDSLDGVLVLLLAFVVSTIRDNHQVGMARLPA